MIELRVLPLIPASAPLPLPTYFGTKFFLTILFFLVGFQAVCPGRVEPSERGESARRRGEGHPAGLSTARKGLHNRGRDHPVGGQGGLQGYVVMRTGSTFTLMLFDLPFGVDFCSPFVLPIY